MASVVRHGERTVKPLIRWPVAIASHALATSPPLLLLAKPRRHQLAQRLQRLLRLGSAGADRDRRPQPRAQRQNPHDRIAADRLAAAGDADLGVEAVDALHKFRRGAGVQTLAV